MRSLISVLLVLVVIAVMVIAPPAQARVTASQGGGACAYAAYHPGFAIACFWEIYLEMGGGFGDWGDSDDLGGSSSAYGGDADGVAGVRGDGDDTGGRR